MFNAKSSLNRNVILRKFLKLHFVTILRSLGFAGEKNISGYLLVSSLHETIEFSSITFPKIRKKIIVWFLLLIEFLQISQSDKNTQHQASQKWTTY